MPPENPQKSPKKEQFHCFLNPAQPPPLPDGAPDKAMSLDIMLYRLTDIEDRLAVVKGEGGGGGMEWEAGMSRCKLSHRE